MNTALVPHELTSQNVKPFPLKMNMTFLVVSDKETLSCCFMIHLLRQGFK